MIAERRRTLATWTAHHANGWATTVTEHENGMWSAWAGPAGHIRLTEQRSGGVDVARAAALLALERQTGHGTCGGRCSAWELHDVTRPDRDR